MIHDFICCEELPSSSSSTDMSHKSPPTSTMITSELQAPEHTLLYGPYYLSLNPLDIQSTAVVVQCKTHSSLLDVYTSCGGTLATAALTRQQQQQLKTMSSSINHSDDDDDGKGSNSTCRQLLSQLFKPVINIDTCNIR